MRRSAVKPFGLIHSTSLFAWIMGGLLLFGSTAEVQASGGGGGSGQPLPTGSQQTGNQPTGFLTPDAAFSGGVDRSSGVIGQSAAAPVGSRPEAATATGAGGRAGGLGGGFGGGLGAAFGNLFGGGNNNQSESSAPPLRTKLRSAVVGPNLAPPQVQRSAAMTLRTVQPINNPSGNPYGGVNVQVVDRTAVLTGGVGSESERRMSQMLLRLQPGVSRIENRLIVAP